MAVANHGSADRPYPLEEIGFRLRDFVRPVGDTVDDRQGFLQPDLRDGLCDAVLTYSQHGAGLEQDPPQVVVALGFLKVKGRQHRHLGIPDPGLTSLAIAGESNYRFHGLKLQRQA